MPTGAKLAGTFALDLLTATELQLDRHTHPTAVSVPVPLHLSGCNALRRKGTRKSVTLGITPHRASGSGCGSNRDVPACLKHSGASPGKARCSELIAVDAQSTSPHDLPDVLGCAWLDACASTRSQKCGWLLRMYGLARGEGRSSGPKRPRSTEARRGRGPRSEPKL